MTTDMREIIVGAMLVSVLTLTGCASQPSPLYHWGSYESQLYNMYAKPGKAEPGEQIVQLTEDIERAQATGGRVPPGVYAHLGYMYTTQGNLTLAKQAFVEERLRYPESAVFIDGLIRRMESQ